MCIFVMNTNKGFQAIGLKSNSHCETSRVTLRGTTSQGPLRVHLWHLGGESTEKLGLDLKLLHNLKSVQ